MKIKDQVHPLYEDMRPLFEEHSPDEYYKYIFQFTMDDFRRRVEMAGFTGTGRVLDAGCGYGQWAVALAEVNERVSACDREPGMLAISAAMMRRFGVEHKVDIRAHDLNFPLPYEDEAFDLVWCWGVIMFVDRDLALREFNRVLKPGGRVLLGSVNSTGRWLYKLVNAAKPFSHDKMIFQMSWKALREGQRYDAMPSLLTSRGARPHMQRYGLEVMAADMDGHVDTSGKGRRLPFFPPRYLGIENNIEVLARKAGPPTT